MRIKIKIIREKDDSPNSHTNKLESLVNVLSGNSLIPNHPVHVVVTDETAKTTVFLREPQ